MAEQVHVFPATVGLLQGWDVLSCVFRGGGWAPIPPDTGSPKWVRPGMGRSERPVRGGERGRAALARGAPLAVA